MTKRTQLSHGDSFEYKGLTFRFAIERDEGSAEPWVEHDGHGPVSEWTTREKKPGERVLVSDHGSKRYYDWAEAIRIAKRDQWGMAGDEGLSKGAKAERAVQADFDRLKAWCDDEWYWCGVVVTATQTGRTYHESLWGIESDSPDYHTEVAYELAERLIGEMLREVRRDIGALQAFELEILKAQDMEDEQ